MHETTAVSRVSIMSWRRDIFESHSEELLTKPTDECSTVECSNSVVLLRKRTKKAEKEKASASSKPPSSKKKKIDDEHSVTECSSSTRKQQLLKKAEREKMMLNITGSNPKEIASLSLAEVKKQVPLCNEQLQVFCSAASSSDDFCFFVKYLQETFVSLYKECSTLKEKYLQF